MPADRPASELPLFPLHAVLFPGGLMGMKVFEARYLDLVASCLRERMPFGVVKLLGGRDSARDVSFETVGTIAEVTDVDSEQQGILQVNCRGGERFRVRASRQRSDGLWLAETEPIAADEPLAPGEALIGTVRGLADAIAALKAQGASPFLEPYRFDQAGWVANRWCEILPISPAARFRLMELTDPLIRLQLVDDFLRSKGVVT